MEDFNVKNDATMMSDLRMQQYCQRSDLFQKIP